MSAFMRVNASRRVCGWLIVLVLVSTSAARAQVQIKDLTRPFVVLDTEGHSAPVRSLIFEGPDRLISGGMDKVIHKWDFADGRPRLTSTIRPATWRGPAGVIYSMALSPKVAGTEARILAVGGYGLWSTLGNITLFKYPGDPSVPNGEVLAILPSQIGKEPNSPGHSNTVTALAFSPDGKLLASAGHDGRVILWDLKTKLPVQTWKPSRVAFNAVAFRPDGKKVAFAGRTGTVYVGDTSNGTLVSEFPGPPFSQDPDAYIILCLSYTPDGKAIVVGREGGQLDFYNSEKLGLGGRLQKDSEVKGPIDSLAVSHDGKTLATAVVTKKILRSGERPRVDCRVELRSLPDGKLLPRSFNTNNLVYALAFNSDDTKLAFAGGDRQAIEIHSLDRVVRPSLTLAGRGESVWRIGFGNDSRTVGFSHAQEVAGPNVEFVGFQLKSFALVPTEPASLHRALTNWEGWSVDPIDPYHLKVMGPKGTFTVGLDTESDRRWWAYSFIPPTDSHPKPVLAVACEAGIVCFRLEGGLRTRIFAGHASPVYDLAPSPDGMWLATGSSDQTVRIWSLAGCDSVPSLGATFRKRADGKTEVATIATRGFAEGMGLKVGDILKIVAVGGRDRGSLENLEQLEVVTPGLRVEFEVLRGAEVVQVGTTRRDSPRISLFVGVDREWVVWTPEGYYETSVAGDRRYLGWHRNGATIDRPTDRFPAETFEKELRRPAVLSALIDTDNQAQAFQLAQNQNPDPAAIVAAQAPPVITLTPSVPRQPDAGVVVPPAGLTIRAQVAAEGRSPITSIRVLVDGLLAAEPSLFANAPDVAEISVRIPVHAGSQKVLVVATNAQGKERLAALEVAAPMEVPKAPTLHVIAIGAGGPFRAAKFPAIPQAAEDARDLRAFFAAPGGKPRFAKVDDVPAIVDDQATGKTLRQRFQAVADSITDRNDALVVVLESHMLTGAKDKFVIAADTDNQPATEDTPTGDEIAAILAKVASRGCKVLLFLDTAHEKAPNECRDGLTDFVRSVSNRGVITFVAATSGVTRPLNTGHGALAEAILHVFDARARSRPLLDINKPMSLDDFQDAVLSSVLELTGRKQFAGYYPPYTISSQSLIFEPNK
jgi:WD40 repeat protein